MDSEVFTIRFGILSGDLAMLGVVDLGHLGDGEDRFMQADQFMFYQAVRQEAEELFRVLVLLEVPIMVVPA